MASLFAEAEADRFAVFGEGRGVDDQVDLRHGLVAVPETVGVVDQIDAGAALGDFIGANHFVEIDADFCRGVRHREADGGGVFLEAPPVAFVGEGFAAGDAQGGEQSPAADKAGLSGREADFFNGEKLLVVKDVTMDHWVCRPGLKCPTQRLYGKRTAAGIASAEVSRPMKQEVKVSGPWPLRVPTACTSNIDFFTTSCPGFPPGILQKTQREVDVMVFFRCSLLVL